VRRRILIHGINYSAELTGIGKYTGEMAEWLVSRGHEVRVEYVVLEASFKPMYEGEMLFMDIVRLMEGYGFSFLRPVGLLSDPRTGEIIQMDALFSRAKRENVN